MTSNEIVLTINFEMDGQKILIHGVSETLHESVKLWAHNAKVPWVGIYKRAVRKYGASTAAVQKYFHNPSISEDLP